MPVTRGHFATDIVLQIFMLIIVIYFRVYRYLNSIMCITIGEKITIENNRPSITLESFLAKYFI